MDKQDVKKRVIENFKMLQDMSVQEYTLFRKWGELNSKKWTGTEQQRTFELKSKIWIPEEPDDYLKLKPAVVWADTPDKKMTWTLLRLFCSSAHWNQNVGRLLKFYVMDKVTMSYLGVISIASDFTSLRGRDSAIGWTKKQKESGMLRHTAMGSTIVPTQPMGFNYVGGKLMSLLTVSSVVENTWNKRYKDTLAGITTTSLYGGYSQYTRLKYWDRYESTTGKIPLEPSDDINDLMRGWLKEHYAAEVERKIHPPGKKSVASHPKALILNMAHSKLGVKPPVNNAPRGVYFCDLYENTKKWLRQEDKELGKKKFDNNVMVLTNLWKEKYASKRVRSLLKNDRYNKDILFYDDLVGLTWEEAKEKYLHKVGVGK